MNPVFPGFLYETKPACVIVGAGCFDGRMLPPAEDDLVIAADGGYAHLKQAGVRCDLLMGDLDSLSENIPADTETRRFPPQKDDTDTMLAVKYGMERGYRRFLLYGMFGGRFDHTAATIQTVLWIVNHGAEVLAFEVKTESMRGCYVTAVHNGTMTFPADAEGYLSVFTFGGEARGVTLENLKYPLSDATLSPDIPLGVSNEFLRGQSARVTVRDGTLILIKPENN